MAYFINNKHDPVLAQLTHGEIARMVLGRMPSLYIDGRLQFVTVGNNDLLEDLRSRYYVKRGHVYESRREWGLHYD